MDADDETITHIIEVITNYGLQVLGGIIILALGCTIAGWAGKTVARLLSRSTRVDGTLTGFLSSLVKYIVLAFVIIAVLNQFGVQTASLIALFGAAGLAVGLAMQGTLSNLAAGVMLLIFRPFKVGQYVVVGGQAGTVKCLNLFFTELATPDNVQIIVPNGSIWCGPVTNYSHHEIRRVDFVLGISYGDSVDQAMTVIQQVIDADERPLDEPASQIVVGNLGESSVDITVRVWVNADDYWPLKFDLTKAFKEALEQKGITIPFPQRDVHMYQVAAAD